MKSIQKSDIVLGLIMLAYAAYATVFILQTSFILDGERYFVLFDDAMISMRYAKNLAHGYGLVWNPGGERVEGYTNPLWVVFMAVFHLLPLAASKVSLPVQISGGIFILASLLFIKKAADLLTGRPVVGLLAAVLTAFYAPLHNWALLGMEVSVLTLILSSVLWLVLRNLQAGRFSPWPYWLLGIGTLVRTDMAVPFLVILGWSVLADRPHRRRHLLWGGGLLVLFLAGQTLFRLAYYGYPFPNTYYLKMVGLPLVLRVARGVAVFASFVFELNWLLFLLPLVVLLFRRDREVLLYFLVFLGQVAYSIYVGGDAWEHKGGANRYFAIAMPVFFTLFVYAADLIREALVARAHLEAPWARALAGAGMVLFVLGAMVNFNFFLNNKSMLRWALQQQPTFVEGNKDNTEIGLDLNKITSPEARIAVVAAGAVPYFADRYSIDLLGKSDPVIAREKVRVQGGILDAEKFRPGHMKWNYDYSIGQLKPDVVAQLWGKTEEALVYLQRDYVAGGAGNSNLYSLRKDSPYILWDRVVHEAGSR
jgi:hypothetical protein